MITDPVTTITLTADTPQSVKFASNYPYYWIDNKTPGNVYARIGGVPVPDSDGTFTIAAGSQLRISGGAFDNDITLLGSGKVQIIASEIASCPFKLGSKGGGNEISGASSYSVDAVEYPLLGLNVYGKSVQDGTPTPDAPVDIVSVGDSGSIAITSTDQNGQSLTAEITSALPLCGIPVGSDGNYTDSTGQKWFCDELVYNADGTCKIIKRCEKIKLTSADIKSMTEQTTSGNYFVTYIIANTSSSLMPISNFFVGVNLDVANTAENRNKFRCFIMNTGSIILRNSVAENDKFTSLDDMKNFVDSNDVYIIYPLETPYEIELTSAEVAALKTLQTFDGVTNFSNSADADMSVKYCTNKAFSEYVLPIFNGMQAQIDELRAAVLSLGGNV
ncbi:MAG: hypothetical protein ACI4JK_02010 [Oscillospiraceae bacterium]